MNQLQSLSRLIDDLHLLSLADAGQLSLNKQRFSPAMLIQEKIAWLKPKTTVMPFRYEAAVFRGKCLADLSSARDRLGYTKYR
ncbi:hypothetical protein [Martelella alba]|uniref:hypothetical protein n=1 Tax=Martelella alba TaxID=2590451 RepID=UPI001E2F91D0|nr:hypothetical protein [Martelella alba]